VRLAFAALAAAAGVLIPIQAGANARLRSALGGATGAALVSFVIGALVLAAIVVASGTTPRLAAARALPWWAWLGGVCGAAFVSLAALCARPLGATALATCTIAGQLLAALALDRVGLLGFAPAPAGPARLVGAALALVGAALTTLP
jgi:transporter family-2 protein